MRRWLLVGEVGLAGLFVALALWVTSGRSEGFDLAVIEAAARLRTPVVDAVMIGFTALGLPWVFLLAVGLLSAVLFGRDRRAALLLIALAITAGFGNELLKALFHRPRPTLGSGIPLPSGFSFPSGHAMGSIAIYGTAAFLLARVWPSRRTGFAVAAPMVIALIGGSRVYLGVHWPTDVLAGYAAGGFLLLLAISAAGRGSAARTAPAPPRG